MSKPALPKEILDLVITCIIDEGNETVAFQASHVVTRTLYACLTLCKATLFRAQEQLYTHCLYIDTPRRLESLLRSYRSQKNLVGPHFDINAKIALSKGLYLAPFLGDDIDDIQVVTQISDLFGLLSSTLKRLIIDMPLRSVYPDDHPNAPIIRPLLRAAFWKLMAVEEFVSTEDELYLSTIMPSDHHLEPPVWSTWPRLRRLALYNLNIDEDLDRDLVPIPNLRTLVLTRPDGELHEINTLWRSLRPDVDFVIVDTHEDLRLRAIRSDVLEVEELPYAPRPTRDSEISDGVDTTLGIVMEAYIVGEPVAIKRPHLATLRLACPPGLTPEDPIEVCQDWVKTEALNGSLWKD